MSPSKHAPLNFPWPEIPAPGEAVEIAEGVLWLSIPLPMALKWVNVVALDDGDSWTLVDTGSYTKATVGYWEQNLAGPLKGKPVGRAAARQPSWALDAVRLLSRLTPASATGAARALAGVLHPERVGPPSPADAVRVELA